MGVSSFFRFTLLLVSATFALGAPLDARTIPTLPTDDAFYRVPDGLETVKPGTILDHRPPPSPIAVFASRNITLKASHQILYRSSDNHGNPTTTVMTVLVPRNPDYSKVLSYQVAQDGAWANCAPSYAFQFNSSDSSNRGTMVTQAELLLIMSVLEQGWVVIVPDHEGPHGAFLANKMAGYTVLDGIRAALSSSQLTGIQSDATVALWGYSGGSVASTFAVEQQPTYAPELKIAGAALGGSVPSILNALNSLNKGRLAGLIPAGITGLGREYPLLKQISEAQVLPEYKAKFEKIKSQCQVSYSKDWSGADVFAMVKDRDVFNREPAKSIMEENSMGHATPKVPLFLYKSVNDQASPVADTDNLVKKYCSNGASVEYLRDEMSEHIMLVATGAPSAISWLKRVMGGEQIKQGCTTRTVASTLLDLSTVEVVPAFLRDALLDLLGKPVGPGGLWF